MNKEPEVIKFLKRPDLQETIFVKPSKYQVEFEIRKIPALREAYLRKAATNKGKYDENKYIDLMMVESIVQPDLKNAQMQTEFGVITEIDLLKSVLSLGEYYKLLEQINNYNDLSKTDTDLIEEAKN